MPPPKIVKTYDDIEFGVDVEELAGLVDNGQGRHPFCDKLVERFDDGGVILGHLDVLVSADTQLVDGLMEVGRLGQIMNLQM